LTWSLGRTAAEDEKTAPSQTTGGRAPNEI
jgi:hypothetical protein